MTCLKWVKEEIVKQKDDVVLLKTVVQFYSFAGNFSPIQKYKLMFLIPYQIVSIIMYVQTFLKIDYLSPMRYFMYGVNMMLSITYTLVCLKNSYNHESELNDFINDLESYDFMMKRQTLSPKENIHKYYWKYVFGNVYYILVHLLPLFTSEKIGYQQVILTIYLAVIHIQIVGTTLVLRDISKIIEKRYNNLLEIIRHFALPGTTDIILWTADEVKVGHLLLSSMVKRMNTLFGERILVIVILTFSSFLGAFRWALMEDLQKLDMNMVLSIVAQIVVFWVSIIQISTFFARWS